MICFTNVSFTYGDEEGNTIEETGVKDVSFQIRPGMCVVLCGKSGSGKSTILRLAGGIAPSFYTGEFSGQVLLDGTEITKLAPEEKAAGVGIVFQDPRSQFFMGNVQDELAFTADNLGYKPEDTNMLVAYQADRFHIRHLLNRSLQHLSSGEKQRVAIAAATILSPKLVIMDEPTANLDKESTKDLLEIIGDLKRKGITVLVSEHRIHIFRDIADQYLYFEGGCLAKEWTAKELGGLSFESLETYGLRPPLTEKGYLQYAQSQYAESLTTDALTHIYRSGAGITGFSQGFQKGTVTALVGSNGAGKTTLCKMLCGLLRPQKGSVFYAGVRQSAAKRRSSSYFVMQDADYQLYADSIGNEILLGRHVDEAVKTQAYAALDTFGLREIKDRHPASLSGGQKQRVILAAAYCSDAKLIVLDEPTSGLDGENLIRIVEWVRLLAENGKIVIIITHDELLIKMACDKVITVSPERSGTIETTG